MSLEQPEEISVVEGEQTPEELFAPYMGDFLPLNKLAPVDRVKIEEFLHPEMGEMKILDTYVSDGKESFLTAEEQIVADDARQRIEMVADDMEALRQEARATIPDVPEAQKQQAEETAKKIIKVTGIGKLLAAGGLGLAAALGGAQNAEAAGQKVDIGGVVLGSILYGVSEKAYEKSEVKKAESQANYNAREQLRQAQLQYNQTIRYIDGQLTALDNPKLQELAQKEANLYWNAQYLQQMAWANTPEQKAQVQARVDAQRAQALGQQEVQKQQQRINFEKQRLQADIQFETTKANIKASYDAEVERAKDRAKQSREQRRGY